MGQRVSSSVEELRHGGSVETPPLVAAALPEELRQLLLESLPSDRKGLEGSGFEHHSDCPERPGHNYMEGYFHAVAESHSQNVASVHPRRGDDLDRRPAPLPLAAFCEAFRRANAKALGELEEALAGMNGGKALHAALRRRAHFADLSVQVHWGDAIRAEEVAWHTDAPNSFLHLALGLQSRRALHALRRRKPRVPGEQRSSPYADAEVMWQEEGAAYLSTPCCFPHAVEYPETSWDQRIVAVQCRLLLTFEDLYGQRDQLDNDPNGQIAGIVFRWLTRLEGGALAIPSLEQVQSVLTEIGG